MSDDNKVLKIGKYNVEITHPERVMFDKQKITKQQLIDYYQAIAPLILPYLKKRPISMQRFPLGIEQEGFYQKEAGSYFPQWITTFALPKDNGELVNYVVVNNEATLIYLVNQSCLTFHPWLSKIDKIEYPDRMIFDLDPSGKDFGLVQEAAHALKNLLDELELPNYVMTTGSRGLHVWVPIKRTQPYDVVRSLSRSIAELLVTQNPKAFTLELRKDKRHGRVFIDYLRNGLGATGVAPYSVRPIDNAPIAMPINWKEALSSGLKPTNYTIFNAEQHISSIANPWEDMEQHAVAITHAIKLIKKLVI